MTLRNNIGVTSPRGWYQIMWTQLKASLLFPIMVAAGCGGSSSTPADPPLPPQPPPPPPTAEAVSIAAAIAFAEDLMDRDHRHFGVYEDVSSPGNHFVALAKIPDANVSVTANGTWTSNPHSGATAFQFVLAAGEQGGYYFQNGVLPAGAASPLVNFGTIADSGVDLTGATRLEFWARGEAGGEVVEFFVGGVGWDVQTGLPIAAFPGSSPRHPVVGTAVTLSTTWQLYSIDVSSLDLSYTLGGFGWFANATAGDVTFYIDDIKYELTDAARNARLNQPRFVKSFVTRDVQPDVQDTDTSDDIDFVLRNLAFSYDNALALLMFLSLDNAEGLRRARLIGDAFVHAANNDRFFDDGRIRTAYTAGDISLPPGWTPNNRIGTAPIPGFFVEDTQTFVEIEQDANDVGNNAWTMIALLALHDQTMDDAYLQAAHRIGEFIEAQKQTTGVYQGYLGGISDPETATPSQRPFASVEHNIDVYIAFDMMARITGENAWQSGSEHARVFVEAAFDTSRGCILAGTLDPNALNDMPGQLPADTQTWAILAEVPLALTERASLFACLETNHRAVDAGIDGFDFNEDRDAVWLEGTAHAALAYLYEADRNRAEVLRGELRAAQNSSVLRENGAIVAATRDGLTTGFGFSFFRRAHIAATAWHVFAQSEYNPYTQAVLPID